MTRTDVVINSATVYVILTIDYEFRFKSKAEMDDFMKYRMDQEFQPNSGYCKQRYNSLRTFDCLFNYHKLPERDY